MSGDPATATSADCSEPGRGPAAAWERHQPAAQSLRRSARRTRRRNRWWPKHGPAGTETTSLHPGRLGRRSVQRHLVELRHISFEPEGTGIDVFDFYDTIHLLRCFVVSDLATPL